MPDEAFASKAVGDGVASRPTKPSWLRRRYRREDLQHQPQFCLETENGAEIVVHMGIDTVALNGRASNVWLKKARKCRLAEPILEMDLDFLNANARSMISPVVQQQRRLQCAGDSGNR
ncbi:hypothetical protein DMH17_11175 [Raoultella planticola]|nr:hypothetical protein [Raoultella planticola]